MTKKAVSSRILKRLEELLNTRELTNAPFILKKSQHQPEEKVFLRNKKRLDYSNKYSEAVKEKIYSGMGFGRWTYEEHKNFIEGIFQFGNKWKEIIKMIKTRNCVQARSHSQKFFFKLFKFADAPDLEHYINLKNLFSFGKEIGEDKLLMLKDFLIKSYDQIENGENIDYFKSNLLVEFLKKLEKSKANSSKNTTEFSSGKIIKKGKRRNRLGRVNLNIKVNEKIHFEIKKIKKFKNLEINDCFNRAQNCELVSDVPIRNQQHLKSRSVFTIEKIFKSKAKSIRGSDSGIGNKTTNLQITEESTGTFKANENKTLSSVNLLEYNNFSFIPNLDKSKNINKINNCNFNITNNTLNISYPNQKNKNIKKEVQIQPKEINFNPITNNENKNYVNMDETISEDETTIKNFPKKDSENQFYLLNENILEANEFKMNYKEKEFCPNFGDLSFLSINENFLCDFNLDLDHDFDLILENPNLFK